MAERGGGKEKRKDHEYAFNPKYIWWKLFSCKLRRDTFSLLIGEEHMYAVSWFKISMRGFCCGCVKKRTQIFLCLVSTGDKI